jgi:hypothetical protein
VPLGEERWHQRADREAVVHTLALPRRDLPAELRESWPDRLVVPASAVELGSFRLKALGRFLLSLRA